MHIATILQRDLIIVTARASRAMVDLMHEFNLSAIRGHENVSAVAEHAWQQHHPIKWEEVRVVDRASKNRELKINRDTGLELPGCWLSMLRANHPPGYNKQ